MAPPPRGPRRVDTTNAGRYTRDVRIIGGLLGGRRLRAPRGAATRPTADRVRQAIFNILGAVDGARVLDLFAGTGALAHEALSRGAAAAVLVDVAAEAVRCARDNAAELGHAGRVRIVRGAVGPSLARLAGPFELVFLDPPYADAAAVAVPALAALPPLLAPGARVVVEHDRRSAPPDEVGALALEDRRRYGDIEVSFYVMRVGA
jgi:16S rRNA (guanine(966)-N(2))-methyltransferase RsmD